MEITGLTDEYIKEIQREWLHWKNIPMEYKFLLLAVVSEEAYKSAYLQSFFKAAPLYVWDAKILRFRDRSTGRLVAFKVVHGLLDTMEKVRAVDAENLAQAFIAGSINESQWRESTLALLRKVHVQATALSVGGYSQITPRMLLQIEQALTEDAVRMQGITAQTPNLVGRSRMWIGNGRASYWRNQPTPPHNPRTEEVLERRILKPGDSCQFCIEQAGLGWQSPGVLSAPGTVPDPPPVDACYTNCRCTRQRKVVDKKNVAQWIGTIKGWSGYYQIVASNPYHVLATEMGTGNSKSVYMLWDREEEEIVAIGDLGGLLQSDVWAWSNGNLSGERFVKGGPGSGNFGHEGRPGLVGGSGNGTGVTLEDMTAEQIQSIFILRKREEGEAPLQYGIATQEYLSSDEYDKARNAITEDLLVRAGLEQKWNGPQILASIVRPLAFSPANSNVSGTHVVASVSRVLGVDRSPYDIERETYWLAEAADERPWMKEEIKQDLKGNGFTRYKRVQSDATMDKVVRATYEKTQALLEAQGIQEIVVHRGSKTKRTDGKSNALEHWTMDRSIAERFSEDTESERIVESRTISVRQVFAVPGSGWGVASQLEVLVLGEFASSQKAARVGVAYSSHVMEWESWFKQNLSSESFAKGGPGSGNFGHAGRPGLVGGSGQGGVLDVFKLPSEDRVWAGGSVSWDGPKPSKQQVGALGEQIAMEILAQHTGDSFAPVDESRNNAPIDIWGDGMAVEVKTGLATNGASAMHWRATIGQPGKEETYALRDMDAATLRKHNEWKYNQILHRKHSLLADLNKVVPDRTLKGMTVGIIMHPNLERADVYLIEGYHLLLSWHNHTSDENYLGTVQMEKPARKAGPDTEQEEAETVGSARDQQELLDAARAIVLKEWQKQDEDILERWVQVNEKPKSYKGGPGSGNFGHSGRPGLVGGSGDGGLAGSTADIPDAVKQREERVRRHEKQFGVSRRHAEMLAVLEDSVWNGHQSAEGYWADLEKDANRASVSASDRLLYKQVQIENRFLEEKDRIPEDMFVSLVENREIVRGFQKNVPLVEWEWKSPASPDKDSLSYIGEGPTAVGYWQDGTTFYKIPKPDYEEQAEKEKALYTAFGNRLPIIPSNVELDNFSSYFGYTAYPVVAMPYISSLSVASETDRSMWLLKSVSDDLRARSILFDLGVANTDRHYGNVGFTSRDELVLIDNSYALDYKAFDPAGNNFLRESTVEAFTRNAFWRTADDSFKIGKVDRRHITFIVKGLQDMKGYDTTPGQKLLENIPEGITWQELFSGYLWEVFA